MGQLADGPLLERFLATGEEAAFAALLYRHGPMVWRVCQRILRHRHNAEDVFQATFLILARKAASIRKRPSVACWLHGVCYRLAHRLLAALARERSVPTNLAGAPPPDPASQASTHEVQATLDDELTRMSEKYRLPLVLCYLEGKTRDEAALALGWSLSTLKRRLERGRRTLAARLRRRGLSLGVVLVGAALLQDAVAAAVPPTLTSSTCKAAGLSAAGQTLAEVISARAITLAEGMVRTMRMTRLKLTAAVVLTVGVLAGSASLWAAQKRSDSAPPPAPETKRPTKLDARPDVGGDLAALRKRGEYLVNHVARCGDCHTPRDARGRLDTTRHLQGADIWFRPRVKPRGKWEDDAPNITASGKAGKWTEAKMIKYLSTGPKTEAPMPSYTLAVEDARAVTAYLRSLTGKKGESPERKRPERKKKREKEDDDDD
jgi:RNA polymerase sigma factor (sigma-70 family)